MRSTLDSRPAPGRVVRGTVGVATVVLFIVAVFFRREPGLFAAAAACGVMWWVWDLLVEHVAKPLGDWMTMTFLGGGVGLEEATDRPNMDDLIRLLESHLTHSTTRQVDINAALRLAEIYRTVKKDPDRAEAVLEIVRARYPDAPELARHERASGEMKRQ